MTMTSRGGAVGMGKWGKPTQTLNSKTAHDRGVGT